MGESEKQQSLAMMRRGWFNVSKIIPPPSHCRSFRLRYLATEIPTGACRLSRRNEMNDSVADNDDLFKYYCHTRRQTRRADDSIIPVQSIPVIFSGR